MAKLHSEIRIKAVDITQAEGAAGNFSLGDVIYDTDSDEFKIHDGTTWQDALSPAGLGANSVNDTHIDFGTGADQVSSDDVPEGATNLYFTNARADQRATLRVNAASLENLSDVATGAADGQVLKWNDAAGEWQPENESAGGASNLSGLTDVQVNAPAEGHILSYVAGTDNEFQNVPFSTINRTEYGITANGSSAYRYAGLGFEGNEDNPKIYLVRGKSYVFTNNAGASHPFQIQTSTGAIENTPSNRYNDGITGLDANRQLQNGNAIVWEVRMDAPDVLYYHCGQHLAMAGEIRILDEGGGSAASSKIEDGIGGNLSKAQIVSNQVEFFTSNSHRWSITSAGHFLPNTHDAFDIGSAEKKVRDLYVSDASIWIGDRHKLAINTDGEMKFLKRRIGRIPSGVNPEDTDINAIRARGGLGAEKNLENMTLDDWRKYADARNIPMHQLYDRDNDLDWENVESDNNIQKAAAPTTSTAIIRKFHVAVDNKDPNIYPEGNAGSANAYYINGRHAPELRLRKGKYRFYQKHRSNANHPLVFRTDNTSNGHESVSAKLWYGYTDISDPANPAEIRQSEYDGNSWVFNTTPYGEAGLTFDPTNTNWEHYVDLTITDATPREFYFACGAHSKMGWKIINESAPVGGGGGATTVSDLTDVSDGAPADNEALVYNDAANQYEPRPILLDLHNQFASRRIDFSVHQIKELHSTLKNNFGGRVIIDMDVGGANEFDPAQGDKIQLDLAQMYDMNVFPKTMNFEIYSRGTDPFTVELVNPASNPNVAGAQILHSDIQAPISVNEDATGTISIGEGQMLIIYCNGASWYYEIRSGL